MGQKAYHSLSEIDGDVDLVILCTPQKTILPLLREAAEKLRRRRGICQWIR
ncbi:MAG: CoA-binding protein [Blautia marasmi]